MSILEFECSTDYSYIERYLKNNIDNLTTSLPKQGDKYTEFYSF